MKSADVRLARTLERGRQGGGKSVGQVFVVVCVEPAVYGQPRPPAVDSRRGGGGRTGAGQVVWRVWIVVHSQPDRPAIHPGEGGGGGGVGRVVAGDDRLTAAPHEWGGG